MGFTERTPESRNRGSMDSAPGQKPVRLGFRRKRAEGDMRKRGIGINSIPMG
jgi:hypothetical protein